MERKREAKKETFLSDRNSGGKRRKQDEFNVSLGLAPSFR